MTTLRCAHWTPSKSGTRDAVSWIARRFLLRQSLQRPLRVQKLILPWLPAGPETHRVVHQLDHWLRAAYSAASYSKRTATSTSLRIAIFS